jgi:ketosteroid isomerase-like protein
MTPKMNACLLKLSSNMQVGLKTCLSNNNFGDNLERFVNAIVNEAGKLQQRRRPMRSKSTVRISIFVLSAAVLACARLALAAETDETGVKNAAAQFYAALNKMFTGELGPMKSVWSHADDVTYMGPGGGFQVGWNEVLKNWEAQAAMRLGGRVEPAEMRITVGTDIAVVSNYEKGENTNAKGESQEVSIRATNIFRKENGEWKMMGHHTDLLPYMDK